MSKKQITIPLFIPHSGCPHCCVFCNQWSVTGVTEKVTTEAIRDTIMKYLSNKPETVERVEIAFFGGSFTAIPADEQMGYLSAVQPYLESGVINSVRISTRPDCIDNKRLELLRGYNVETVELGVQSFSDDVLKASGRGHTSSDVDGAVKMLKDNGFRVGIQLMPGLPDDSFERSIYSAERTVRLSPDDARIYPAVVLKDTAMERLYNEKRYSPLTLEGAVDICSKIYGMFNENGINVIRIGLHPMDMSAENVISGPYHAALGFMVKSRYRRGVLETVLMSAVSPGDNRKKISLLIPEKLKEEYIGMKRCNIIYLEKKFSIEKIEYMFGHTEIPVVIS